MARRGLVHPQLGGEAPHGVLGVPHGPRLGPLLPQLEEDVGVGLPPQAVLLQVPGQAV